MMLRVIQSLLLPPILWLLLGAPPLNWAGNAALCVFLLLHYYGVVWLQELFRLLRGDRFTYGMVATGLNMLSFAVSFIVVWVVFHLHQREIQEISGVAPYVWGFLLLNLAGTAAIPLMSHRRPAPLPDRQERRSYVPPGEE